MMNVVVPILLGAAIGYVTNAIAIKMLFWPKKAIRIFGLTIPFTPGLFVKRREQFSSSVAGIVEKDFVDHRDIYSTVMEMSEDGRLDEISRSFGPVVHLLISGYFKKKTRSEFERDCRKAGVSLRRSRMVSRTVGNKIDSMDIADIEAMVVGVVNKELKAITWLGAALGAIIGAAQIFI